MRIEWVALLHSGNVILLFTITRITKVIVKKKNTKKIHMLVVLFFVQWLISVGGFVAQRANLFSLLDNIFMLLVVFSDGTHSHHIDRKPKTQTHTHTDPLSLTHKSESVLPWLVSGENPSDLNLSGVSMPLAVTSLRACHTCCGSHHTSNTTQRHSLRCI